MPTSSFDTFFACTIIVVAVLIGTAFLSTTMHTRIVSTQDINKNGYLKAIADHIITSPGSPVVWGTSRALPADFGLASSPSTSAYELDMDKISRLNSLNVYSLSYADMENASKLNNIALSIKVSQLMSVNVLQTESLAIGSDTSFTFTVSTRIDSEPTSASLHCYVSSDNYLKSVNSMVPDTGIAEVTVQIPSAAVHNALFILFARTTIDDRITSYAVYNFTNSTQETTPTSRNLALSTLDYKLSLKDDSPGLTIQNAYVFSYSYQQSIPSIEGSQTPIPKLIDKSPLVLVVCGLNNTAFFQEWTSYPQLPLKTGANFVNSEQNVFSYVVTIDGVLYRLDISLGDLPK